MKKVLIGLLALAIAGGGAFAQGWTFNGLVDGGLFLRMADGAEYAPGMTDDPNVALIGSRDGTNAVRAQLDSTFVNADGTAGFFLRIRQDGDADLFFETAQAWMSLMDNMLTVYGGRINHTHFNTLDRMTGTDMGEGLGLSFIVRPMDNLTLGFGGFTTTAAGGRYLDDASQFKTTFGLAFNEPDLFQVRFGLRNTNEVGGGWGNWGEATMGRGQGSLAYLSFSYLALQDMHVSATAGFQNLEEFGDYGAIRFYASFGHTGLVDGMDLRLNASFSISQSDIHDDAHIWIWASVDYAVSDMVVPRLDLHYVMGGTADLSRLHHEGIRNNSTFNSDDSFFQLRPSVQLRAAPNAFLEIGCIFHINLGDGSTGWSADNTDIGLYALVRMTF